jgi:hypothetical protein
MQAYLFKPRYGYLEVKSVFFSINRYSLSNSRNSNFEKMFNLGSNLNEVLGDLIKFTFDSNKWQHVATTGDRPVSISHTESIIDLINAQH